MSCGWLCSASNNSTELPTPSRALRRCHCACMHNRRFPTHFPTTDSTACCHARTAPIVTTSSRRLSSLGIFFEPRSGVSTSKEDCERAGLALNVKLCTVRVCFIAGHRFPDGQSPGQLAALCSVVGWLAKQKVPKVAGSCRTDRFRKFVLLVATPSSSTATTNHCDDCDHVLR